MKGKIQEYWVNVRDLKKKVIVEPDVQTKNQFKKLNQLIEAIQSDPNLQKLK
jgi:hypothetical protein